LVANGVPDGKKGQQLSQKLTETTHQQPFDTLYRLQDLLKERRNPIGREGNTGPKQPMHRCTMDKSGLKEGRKPN
jgi:hypothetical protein